MFLEPMLRNGRSSDSSEGMIKKQEQEVTDNVKKSCSIVMEEEDHNFSHGADNGAKVQQYAHHQYLGWQECDGGPKKLSLRH